MAKYGYKKGQGLGKSEQGMSTALYVEKTSKRGGKIIHEKDIPIGWFLTCETLVSGCGKYVRGAIQLIGAILDDEQVESRKVS